MTEKAEPQDQRPADLRAGALRLLDTEIAETKDYIGTVWPTSKLLGARRRLSILEYVRGVVADPGAEARRQAQVQLREAVREFQEALNSGAWKDAWVESKRRLAALADGLAQEDPGAPEDEGEGDGT